MDQAEASAKLKQMTREELLVLAKSLGIPNRRAMKKMDLISELLTVGDAQLERVLWPTTWQRYHNHFYGVVSILGVVLSILFFYCQDSSILEATSVETPLRFVDFANMTPAERVAIMDKYEGTLTVWEGFLEATSGYELGGLQLPLEVPVSVQIRAASGDYHQITADCQFGEIPPTDSGCEEAFRLNVLTIGQRVRISGKLGGDSERPILTEARLEAEWPLGDR